MRLPRATTARALGSVALLLLSACELFTGPKGRALRPELIRLATPAPSAAALGVVGAASASATYGWSSAISIASLRSPIRAIELRGEGGSSNVYRCTADSNDGCLVDLAGPELQDLLSAGTVTVRTGTYTSVEIYTCDRETTYHAFLTGSVTVDGSTYSTKASGVLGAGAAEAVQLEYTGCARTYPLPVPLEVADTAGAPVSLKLYFDIRDVAWGSLGSPETAGAWLPSGCAGPRPTESAAPGSPGTPFLCAGYPDVAGVVDDRVPVVERYRINDGATIGLLFMGSTGLFVGGYSRRFFQEGQTANPGFNADTPVSGWSANGDGSFRLSTYGGYGPGGVPVSNYLVMPSFRRESHSGTATRSDAASFPYVAVRLD
jgi:hypothetical protein